MKTLLLEVHHRDGAEAERGDVPGWVLVTLVRGPKLFGSRLTRLTGGGGSLSPS